MDETGQSGADATARGNGAGDHDEARGLSSGAANGSWSTDSLLEWRPPGVPTGRAAVGSARVNGDGDPAGVDPFPPDDDPPRGYPNRAEPADATGVHGAGGNGHPVHGSPLPLPTPEHSAMIDDIPYADRQETAD
ncbi:MAG: hypothetical protein QOE03_984, partial [Micromonosporaceae bacterium]|nr:hypothetical protein [Micromonosporaceae bacterium]